MEFFSVGPVDGGPSDLCEAIDGVASRLDGPRLAVLYLPFDADHSAYLRAATDGLGGGTVVGATTAGAAFTERGVSRDRPVAAVLGGPGFDYDVAVAADLRSNPAGVVQRACDQLVSSARRKLPRAQSVLCMADGFACDGEQLVHALSAATPPHWKYFGATAGDDWRFRESHLFANGEVLSGAAVFVGLFTETPTSLAAQHGFTAAAHSREYTITRIDGSRLRTLNDEPAAGVYRGELARLGLLADGEDLVHAMFKHELGAKTLYGTELKIRAPLGVEPDGTVLLAGSLPVGTVVRVVTATPDQLVTAAANLSRRALDPLQSTAVRGGLIFDCGARHRLLGDRYQDHVSAFLGGRSFPIVGTTGYGEFAKFAGSVEGFHNTTAVMAAW